MEATEYKNAVGVARAAARAAADVHQNHLGAVEIDDLCQLASGYLDGFMIGQVPA